MSVFSTQLCSLSRLSIIAGLLGIVAATSVKGAPAEDPALIKSALDSSKGWLAEIDSGKYDQSYTEGCVAFHNKVSRDQWTVILKALRPALGNLVSRKMASYAYKPDGFEGLQGECMVIKYNSSFAKAPTDLELVVLKREDGQWRGAGYNSQPQGEDQDTDSPPPANAQTEVNQQPVH